MDKEQKSCWGDGGYMTLGSGSPWNTPEFCQYLYNVSPAVLIRNMKYDGFWTSQAPVVKNLPANAGDVGSIPYPGRFHVPWGN